jgi:hypothetical protein
MIQSGDSRSSCCFRHSRTMPRSWLFQPGNRKPRLSNTRLTALGAKYRHRRGDILPGVVNELAKMAGFTDGAYPKDGVIDVPFSGLRLAWKIRVGRADAPCVLTSNRKR